MTGKWMTTEDDTNFKEMREIGPRKFQFIEVIDMIDACGDEAKDTPFVAELSLVDLSLIPDDQLESAAKCVDLESWCHQTPAGVPAPTPAEKAMACFDYGCKALLESFTGKGMEVLKRKCRSAARTYLEPAKLEAQLDKPVNALGSSAREFMAGDFFSAMQRGAESGDPSARLMAKMHGVDQHVIDDARPEDFLPFVMGYMRALAGLENDAIGHEDEFAPEYTRGFDRGVRVKAGQVPAPGWIRTAAPNKAQG